MRKRNSGKRLSAILMSTLLMGALTGCGSGISYNTSSAPQVMEEAAAEVYDSAIGMESGYMESEGVVVEENGATAQTERKRIRTVEMTVETKEFDILLSELDKQIEALGGYIEHNSVYNGSSYSGYYDERSAYMTIRIPQQQLDGFLDTVAGIGNVISKEEREEDVTLAYVDLASHKEALETEQTRLLELLEQAANIEDIITIEQRLSDVRYQIESMESQLRTYDNRVDYSTVSLDIREVGELTPIVKETVWERISSGFMDSIKSIGNGIKEIFVWLMINLPYLVIWAAVIVLIVWLARRSTKKAALKKMKEMQNPNMQPMPDVPQQTTVSSTTDKPQ